MRWFEPDDLPGLQHETVSALGALASSVGPGAGVATLQRAALAARTQAGDRDDEAGGRSAAVS